MQYERLWNTKLTKERENRERAQPFRVFRVLSRLSCSKLFHARSKFNANNLASISSSLRSCAQPYASNTASSNLRCASSACLGFTCLCLRVSPTTTQRRHQYRLNDEQDVFLAGVVRAEWIFFQRHVAPFGDKSLRGKGSHGLCYCYGVSYFAHTRTHNFSTINSNSGSRPDTARDRRMMRRACRNARRAMGLLRLSSGLTISANTV